MSVKSRAPTVVAMQARMVAITLNKPSSSQKNDHQVFERPLVDTPLNNARPAGKRRRKKKPVLHMERPTSCKDSTFCGGKKRNRGGGIRTRDAVHLTLPSLRRLPMRKG